MAKAASAFNPEPIKIFIGTTPVDVKPAPMARIKRFQGLWVELFEKVNDLQLTVQESATDEAPLLDFNTISQKLIDIITEQPYNLLLVAIPDLPREPFDDEDNGVTFPQLIRAFETVLEVNELGWLKKITPFFQNLILSIDPNQMGTPPSPKIG